MLIRKKLTPAEFSTPFLRYNADCDCVQFTPDNGETWVDQPVNDPRTSDAYRLPPLTGDDTRCRAAEGMTAFVRAIVNERIDTDTALEFAGGILGIVAFIPGFNVLWALILALASFAVTIAREILEAAFEESDYDQIRCIFFCNIDENGQMSQAQFDSAYADLIDLNAVARTWCQYVFNTFGCVGLTDAGVSLEAAADCDCDCGWCYEFDFTVNDGGWLPVVVSGTDFAVYSAGVGWTAHIQNDGCSNHAYIYMRFAFGMTIDNLADATMDFTLPYYSGTVHFYDQRLGGSIASRQSCGDMITSPQSVTLTAVPCDELDVTINSCDSPSGMTITKLTFRGFGDCPFGTPNCE